MTILPDISLASFGVEGGTDTARFHCGCSVRFYWRLIIGPTGSAEHASTDHRIATMCSRKHAVALARILTPKGATWEMNRDADRFTFDVPS